VALVGLTAYLAVPSRPARSRSSAGPSRALAAEGPRTLQTCTPVLTENFDNVATLPGAGWFQINRSEPLGTTGWYQGDSTVFTSQAGAANAFIMADFDNTGTTGGATISNWLITPVLTLHNGDVLSFYTRTVTAPEFPDRLEVRMSPNGASTNVGSTSTSVGDFTFILLTINPSLTPAGYPSDWTQYEVTINGLGGATSGRLAFRYFVTDAGEGGSNSDHIGIDTVTYGTNCITPTPTQTLTPSVTLTPSITPTPDLTPRAYNTVAPCRAIDTRTTDAPALAGGSDRAFTVAGKCGVPAGAKAVSINVTVASPTANGDLRLYQTTLPLVSTINFAAGQTRANNAVAGLNGAGQFVVRTDMAVGKTVHFIVDINGYFQ
jgi:hypothetical protein